MYKTNKRWSLLFIVANIGKTAVWQILLVSLVLLISITAKAMHMPSGTLNGGEAETIELLTINRVSVTSNSFSGSNPSGQAVDTVVATILDFTGINNHYLTLFNEQFLPSLLSVDETYRHYQREQFYQDFRCHLLRYTLRWLTVAVFRTGGLCLMAYLDATFIPAKDVFGFRYAEKQYPVYVNGSHSYYTTNGSRSTNVWDIYDGGPQTNQDFIIPHSHPLIDNNTDAMEIARDLLLYPMARAWGRVAFPTSSVHLGNHHYGLSMFAETLMETLFHPLVAGLVTLGAHVSAASDNLLDEMYIATAAGSATLAVEVITQLLPFMCCHRSTQMAIYHNQLTVHNRPTYWANFQQQLGVNYIHVLASQTINRHLKNGLVEYFGAGTWSNTMAAFSGRGIYGCYYCLATKLPSFMARRGYSPTSVLRSKRSFWLISLLIIATSYFW